MNEIVIHPKQSLSITTARRGHARDDKGSSTGSSNMICRHRNRRQVYFYHYQTNPLQSCVLIEFNIHCPMSQLIRQVGEQLLLTIQDPSAWCFVSHGNFKIHHPTAFLDGAQYMIVCEALYRICLAPPQEEQEHKDERR